MIFKSFKKLLLRKKKYALFETEADLAYIETYKSHSLHYDETEPRKRMKALKLKEDRTKEEQQEYSDLVDEISTSTAVKAEHEKLREQQFELRDYISMLS